MARPRKARREGAASTKAAPSRHDFVQPAMIAQAEAEKERELLHEPALQPEPSRGRLAGILAEYKETRPDDWAKVRGGPLVHGIDALLKGPHALKGDEVAVLTETVEAFKRQHKAVWDDFLLNSTHYGLTVIVETLKGGG